GGGRGAGRGADRGAPPGGPRRLPPLCWRLHQPDLEARGRRSRETAWRNLAGGDDLSDSEQSVLALRRALRLLPARCSGAATAGPGRFSVSPKPGIPRRAAEPAASGPRDPVL